MTTGPIGPLPHGTAPPRSMTTTRPIIHCPDPPRSLASTWLRCLPPWTDKSPPQRPRNPDRPQRCLRTRILHDGASVVAHRTGALQHRNQSAFAAGAACRPSCPTLSGHRNFKVRQCGLCLETRRSFKASVGKNKLGATERPRFAAASILLRTMAIETKLYCTCPAIKNVSASRRRGPHFKSKHPNKRGESQKNQ